MTLPVLVHTYIHTWRAVDVLVAVQFVVAVVTLSVSVTDVLRTITNTATSEVVRASEIVYNIKG